MSVLSETVIRKLEQNNATTLEAGVDILLRLLDNVIKDPSNPKFRTIKLENKIIKEKLLSVDGMLDVLLNVGFEMQSAVLHLPHNVTLAKIKKCREFLSERVKNKLNENVPQPAVKPKVKSLHRRRVDVVPDTQRSKIRFPSVLSMNNPFLKSLEVYSDGVMQYKNKYLIEYAKSIIPIHKLEGRAIKKLRSIQKAIKSGELKEPEPCVRDLLLVELVNWFNEEFFEWVDSLPCKKCNQSSDIKNVTVEDGVRVEVIKCCGTETKFYRYNDVSYLLRTRRGRCGEYANCFTFICVCMGYDARHVYASFDHVWTEVYSLAQKKWIHIDPSDNVVDSPLMYQHGWHRRIDYAIAFSVDEVQDVTWRYTNDHKKTLRLRQQCSEEELLDTIIKLNKKRQQNMSPTKKKYLAKRCLNELVELTLERTPTENEKKGRSSGSLTWRQTRGEQESNNFYVFEPSQTEIDHKQFNLRYSCSQDVYYRYLKKDDSVKITESHKEWQSCVFSCTNMFRKVERDWKMVYLARHDGTESGELKWKFDFSKANLKIKNFSLDLQTKTFENGRVSVQILSAEGSTEVIGSSGLSISVKCIGEKETWQHAQVFRQPLHSVEYPFDLKITFH